MAPLRPPVYALQANLRVLHAGGALFSLSMIFPEKRRAREIMANDFPVVCVGGSAGGLDAYIRLLRDLPADLGVAIVFVNHVRNVATRLHEILPRYTSMPVELIVAKQRNGPVGSIDMIFLPEYTRFESRARDCRG